MATAAEGTTDVIDMADLTDEQLEALENGAASADQNGATEDEQDEQGEQQGDSAPGAAAPAADVPDKDAQAPASAPAAPAPEKPAGIASKNGKHVLPYHVLTAERRRADREAQRADELARQLENLKAGKQPEESDQLTEDVVRQAEEDFPEHGKKLRAAFERMQELEAKVGQAGSPSQEQGAAANPLQEAIDQVPMLLEWQVTDPEKFGRAQEIDEVLKKSPKWKGKPLEERFAHVTRMVAEEYDIPVDDEPAPQPSQARPTRVDPQRAIATATRTRPNTLSDFKGGATPDIQDTRIERLSPVRQVNRWADMTDDEIDAALAKSGG